MMLEDEIYYLEEISGILRKKYSLCILTDLLLGTDRFQDFQSHIPHVSSKVLNETLILLEEHELIEKDIISEKPRITKYHLTRKGKHSKEFIIEYYNFLIKISRNEEEIIIINNILNRLK